MEAEARAKLLDELKAELAGKTPRKSRLADHEALIEEMREAGADWRTVARYLRKAGVKVSAEAVRTYWKRHHGKTSRRAKASASEGPSKSASPPRFCQRLSGAKDRAARGVQGRSEGGGIGCAHHAARELSDQPEDTQAGGGDFRLGQDGGRTEAQPVSGNGTDTGLGELCGRDLQSAADSATGVCAGRLTGRSAAAMRGKGPRPGRREPGRKEAPSFQRQSSERPRHL